MQTKPEVNKTRCGGCWEGSLYIIRPDPNSRNYKLYTNCDNCGLPGDKPAASVFDGHIIDYYVNHGFTWQSYTVAILE